MSGNRYFSETTSMLRFHRIAPAPDAITAETRDTLIAEAETANLSEGLLNLMKRELSAKVGKTDMLSPAEMSSIDKAIKEQDMGYYGVQVSENGISFEGTQEGNLYDPAHALTKIFDSVSDTVLFSGTVEIFAVDIDDYARLEIKDSKVISEKSAKITWV